MAYGESNDHLLDDVLSPVRLSVNLSHGWISQKTVEVRIIQFSPRSNPIRLFCG